MELDRDGRLAGAESLAAEAGVLAAEPLSGRQATPRDAAPQRSMTTTLT
jgi:hypothetical protein